MSSSPPAEAPHFRGKTLTPESPVPVHVPEPQNIPVLQKQTDEVFNLMSTHMAQPSEPGTVQNILYDAYQQYDTQGVSSASDVGGSESKKISQVSQEGPESGRRENGGHDYTLADIGKAWEQQQESHTPQNHLPSKLHPSASVGAHESLSTHDQKSLTPIFPSQTQDPTAVSHVSSSPFENAQDASVSQGARALETGLPLKPDPQGQNQDASVNGEGVNYQTLLDHLSPPLSTASREENITSFTSPFRSGIPIVSDPSTSQTPIATLPIPLGLPPRPPPQEKPAIHPNYTPGEDIRSYHNPSAQNSNSQAPYNTQQGNSQRPLQTFMQNNEVAPNGLPPPPLATFQQPLSNPNQAQSSPQLIQHRQKENQGRNVARPAQTAYDGEDEYPRRPEVEKLYEEFLHDEAIYVAEGTWDRFPQGSRLFVGNLFTEKATKRDIFYIFHKYGRLAQISMKSAYGFVQYHDANACFQALQNEQGIEIRGRKIHLEISKPQKNKNNAVATAAGDNLRAGYNRRSRSPDYRLGGTGRGQSQRLGIDRGVVPHSFDRRVRDDYRPNRSPSPRGFRGRDNFRGRERSPERYFRGRSRSPYDRNGRYRSRSPRSRVPEVEAEMPMARRNSRDVPDVQIILVEEIDRTFVGYIRQAFLDRGLRCDILQLPRVSLEVVIKRQIVEGVQAIVQISRKSQVTGKIPLQVYDRSGGVDNVRFDDYADLDANVAAEVVLRAKTTHLPPAPTPAQYSAPPSYGQPHYPPQAPQPPQPQQMPPQQPQSGSDLAKLITTLDGPALQNLLGAMSRTPQTPSTPQQYPQASPHPNQSQNLASLLHSVARQQPVQQGYQYGPGQSQQQQQQQQQHNAFSVPTPNPPFANNSAFSSLMNNGGGRPPSQGMSPQQQPAEQQNLQSMLAQLAKYKQ